jgi:hypothetical protein
MLQPSELAVIDTYLKQLAALTKERLKIEHQLSIYETGLRGILALHDDEEVMPYLEQLDSITKPEGFTDAIRKCLRASLEPLTPSEVKEMLPATGFDLSGYSNPLASIHTILKRLAKTEYVESVITKDGKTGYKWMTVKLASERDAVLVADLMTNRKRKK